MTTQRRTLIAAAAGGLALGLTGCNSGSSTPSSSTPMPSATGTITIGVSTDEPGVSLKQGSAYSRLDLGTGRICCRQTRSSPQWDP